jgi:hypothetical protein
MKRVIGGSVLLALLTVAATAGAESPMTPSRPNSQTASNTWVEPPPSAQPSASAGPAGGGGASTAIAGVPAAKPETRASRETGQRPARRSARSSRPSSDSMAARLNRQELNRIRSGSSRYYRGYWSGSGY